MGTNHGWNHAGNIVAAVVAMALVSQFGLTSVFCSVAARSLLTALAVLLIRENDLDEKRAAGFTDDQAQKTKWTTSSTNPPCVRDGSGRAPHWPVVRHLGKNRC